ncbi:MAG: penicillin-binding protein activator [Aestuariivita sp.]|nr:penicillin-binding protein activator [Aestuariivita sp.]
MMVALKAIFGTIESFTESGCIMVNFFRFKYKFCNSILLLAVGVMLASCGLPVESTRNNFTLSGTPISVALLVPSGSEEANENDLAQSLVNAANLALIERPNVPIALKLYETAGDPDTAAIQAAQAVAEGAQVILGPVFSDTTQAASAAVGRNGPRLLSFSNNAAIAGGNVFILGQSFVDTADRLVEFAAQQGKARAITLYGDTVSGNTGREAIQQALRSSLIDTAGTIPYQLTQQSVIDTIPSVKAIVDSEGADLIFLTATSAGALPLLVQLLPEAGLAMPEVQLVGLSRWDLPVQTLDLPGVQDGWFALPNPDLSRQFANRYREIYADSPHPIASLAFDGMIAIITTLEESGSNRVNSATLTQSQGFDGANGLFRFNPDGSTKRALAIATVDNKQVIVIDPAPKSLDGVGS